MSVWFTLAYVQNLHIHIRTGVFIRLWEFRKRKGTNYYALQSQGCMGTKMVPSKDWTRLISCIQPTHIL